jgi:hypothetical protein
LLRERVEAHVSLIYPQADAGNLTSMLLDAFWPDGEAPSARVWQMPLRSRPPTAS